MNIDLPEETETRLRALVAEVLRVNQQFNLTSVRDPEAAWERHVLDSLEALPTGLLEGVRRVIDVGSGPGFPGLALAMARPQLKMVLLDATAKKCRFLENTIAMFELNARVVNGRAETIGRNRMYRAAYDVATARAVGSMSEVSELCLPLVRVGGNVILWRGERARDELKSSKKAIELLGGVLSSVKQYSLSAHQGNFHLVVIQKQSETPPRFPRRDGLPKSEPL